MKSTRYHRSTVQSGTAPRYLTPPISTAATTSSTRRSTSNNAPTVIYEKSKEGDAIIRKYSVGKLLGKGGFAKVYLVTDMVSGNVYAAKVIDRNSLKKEKTKQKLMTEIKIHKSVNHKNVVKFEHFFNDDHYIYILLEICYCQSMIELLKARKRLNEAEAKFILYQVLIAVQHLHNNRIIHRDLKLGNLLLTEDMVIKIADFGLATQLEFDGQRKRTICGTPNYIAPEILRDLGHSYEVDIWSIGVILYTMLVGVPPFETNDVKSTYKKIKANIYSFPEDIYVSDVAKSLIRRILNPEPSLRPTIQEIFADRFFVESVGKHITCPPSLRQYASLYSTAPKAKSGPSPPSTSRTPFQSIQNTYSEKESVEIPSLKKTFTKPAYNHPYAKPTTSVNRYVPSIRPASSVSTYAKRYAVGNDSSQDSPIVAARPRAQTPSPATSGPSTGHATFKKLPSPKDDEDDCNLTNMHETLSESYARLQNQQPVKTVAVKSSPVETTEYGSTNEEMRDACEVPDPDIWVTQWADFTCKYGLAYKLSNGYVGACFNDVTKILWKVDSNTIDYMERKKSSTTYDEKHTYSDSVYPDYMNKKITLIKFFRSFMEDDSKARECTKGNGDGGVCGYTGSAPISRSACEGVYVKRWLRTRHAIIFRLSNHTVQVCFFDNTEIILSSEARLVSYTDHSGKRVTYTLSDIMKDPQPDLSKRLKYTKDILYQLVSKQKST